MFGSGFLGGVAVVLSGVPGFWGIVPGCSGVPVFLEVLDSF